MIPGPPGRENNTNSVQQLKQIVHLEKEKNGETSVRMYVSIRTSAYLRVHTEFNTTVETERPKAHTKRINAGRLLYLLSLIQHPPTKVFFPKFRHFIRAIFQSSIFFQFFFPNIGMLTNLKFLVLSGEFHE